MPKPLTKPPLYRLTLRADAVHAFARIMARQKQPRLTAGVLRPDGQYDVGVTQAFFDQLQTHALPKENLSNTVLRVDAAANRAK